MSFNVFSNHIWCQDVMIVNERKRQPSLKSWVVREKFVVCPCSHWSVYTSRHRCQIGNKGVKSGTFSTRQNLLTTDLKHLELSDLELILTAQFTIPVPGQPQKVGDPDGERTPTLAHDRQSCGGSLNIAFPTRFHSTSVTAWITGSPQIWSNSPPK